jgi:hypothetical protein
MESYAHGDFAREKRLEDDYIHHLPFIFADIAVYLFAPLSWTCRDIAPMSRKRILPKKL